MVFLITPSFLGKNWPETELRNALAMDIAGGRSRIILILDVPHDKLVERYPLLADSVGRSWADGVATIASSIEKRLARRPARWHVVEHPDEYTGAVWGRVTPDPKDRGTHQVSVVWGSHVLEMEMDLGNGPVSFLHHKEHVGAVPMQVRVVPDAIVTMGVGTPPDDTWIDADEGWKRSADATVPPSLEGYLAPSL